MLKASLLSLIAAASATAAYASLPAAASGATMPTPVDCVRNDVVVCVYRVVTTAELNALGGAGLASPAGLPGVERIELRRIDDTCMVLLEYFAPDPALQGVAL